MFVGGLILVKSFPAAEDYMLVLPYLCIGIGTGVFGYNLGELLKFAAVKKDPAAAKQIEIETKDERNVTIALKAKSKAYDLMTMVFAALLLAFAMMSAELYIILTFTAAYLFIVGTNAYYLIKYRKEM